MIENWQQTVAYHRQVLEREAHRAHLIRIATRQRAQQGRRLPGLLATITRLMAFF